MFGAIIGDVCGSVYEWRNMKTSRLYTIPLDNPECNFTDDTVLTVAVAEACLGDRDYAKALKTWGRKYHDVGYGPMFQKWLAAPGSAPYGSFGNGSAMRVAPIGWLFETLEETLAEAKRSAEATHDHPEGIKGAQAVAAAIFWARAGKSKKVIRRQIKQRFGYDLDRNVGAIRPGYSFDATCQGSVPEAIIAFLDSHDFEHAIRLAISLGGDSDTIACITGSIAEAFYKGVPDVLWEFVEARLTDDLRAVATRFREHIAQLRRTPPDRGISVVEDATEPIAANRLAGFIDSYQTLSERFPNTEYGGNLAHTLLKQGEILDALGDVMGAIKCIKEAVSIYRRLDFSDFATAHLFALFYLCETALRHGEQDMARQAYELAKNVEQECIQTFGSDYEPWVENEFQRIFQQ